jgi:hypothetical protein
MIEKTIPLKFGTPIEYARKFLDAPDERHPMWTFLDVPIEVDFDLTPENVSPYAIQILDRMAEIEKTGVVTKIIVKNGNIQVLGN